MNGRPVLLQMGAQALLVDQVDSPAAYAAAVRRLADAGRLPAVVDVVPAASTVLVTFSAAPDLDVVAPVFGAIDADAIVGEETNASLEVVEIPTRYDGADLASVAETTALTIDEVVALHSSVEYTVGFCGFSPGFAYLAGLPPALHLPRLATPRHRVPTGSVAIATNYSAVYPRESPGGWHLLGATEVAMFDPRRQRPALLAPGTRVRFVPR